MRIITFNANGIRAAAKHGFFDWLETQNADIVCIQETKAQITQLTDDIFRPNGFHCFYHDAVKKGYSGVALYSRREPQRVQYGIGWAEIDAEGRYLEADFGHFKVISLYVHSGTSGDVRQQLKYQFMDKFWPYLQQRQPEQLIICGDINIAHKNIDLENWQANQKCSGFLPEERAWLDQVFSYYVDAFRVVNQQAEQYTWWSYRAKAWDRNVGWRIDYHIISPSLADKVQAAEIYIKQRFSDHAPLSVDYDLNWDK